MKFYATHKRKAEIRIQILLMTLMAFYLTAFAGCACLMPAKAPSTDPEMLQGYLAKDQEPNSLKLLPSPPLQDSAAFAADQEAYMKTRSLIDTPRWKLAIADADLSFPAAPQAFACSLNTPITPEAVPNLYVLMRRSMADAGIAPSAAKKHYQRIRPFVFNHENTCTPDWDKYLARNGSYPSGHTTVGWTWALILAEIAPERADAILSRGYAFGQSRVICGAHWQSDVTAGRVVAAAVVAKLHTDPVFRAQLDEAKKEWTAAQAKGLKPAVDCRAEAGALAF